jgi:glucose/mannose-6-phosphate isomerase
MNLNDPIAFQKLDPANMLDEIRGLPEQLESAWELGLAQPNPSAEAVDRVIIAGMGGSAIGADLVAAYLAPQCRVPIFVHRDYDLPAWATGENTLVIASSHSGNTEETLSAAHAAAQRGCQVLAISTGGKLAEWANSLGFLHWRFEHAGQPRAAVGYSFGLLLAAFTRLGRATEPGAELEDCLQAMRSQRAELDAQVPDTRNLAKRLAGQLIGRYVTVMGSDLLAPVARRWKGQLSEVAKAWAQFEFLPEADHNTLAGIVNPEPRLNELVVLFLQSPSDHPRNRLRSELTRKIFMLQGIATDFVNARGASRLAHLWTALQLGDYIAYYLAMAYQVDPTPVEMIESLKQEMKTAGG